MSRQDDMLDEDGDAADEMDSAALSDFAYALSADTHVRFVRRGPRLLVSFDVIGAPTTDLSAVEAMTADTAEHEDWSILSLIARGPKGFRDAQTVAFFDAMVDSTLLDQFDDVLFHGAGSGGHAALGYALTAPLARVLALAPRAPEVEDPASAGRYTPDPASLDAAGTVWIVRDAGEPSTGFACERVQWLECSAPGGDVARWLVECDVLDDLLGEAMAGTLTRHGFFQVLRARRNNTLWLRRLVARLTEREHTVLAAIATREIGLSQNRKRYVRRFEQLKAELDEKGIRVPPRRAPRRVEG